ncbi:MAG: radical SAM protein [Candidatus Uhrbacteria bacterium]|nr:radical SAM protein [Candidatus Uhrbacteria bacterium]
MTHACTHDCFHCFTNKTRRTLTLTQIKRVLMEAADMGTHAIDFLGEGEPTLDPDFFAIIEHTSALGMIPVVFTDAATRMMDRDFVRRTFDAGASVSPKCDSLFNRDYQNRIVNDSSSQYFDQRRKAIDLLLETGFNTPAKDGTTRMGFDMVVTAKNIAEVPQLLRYCRESNLWVIFTFYLPSGRSGHEDFDKSLAPTNEQKQVMKGEILKIDINEFDFNHPIWSNITTSPCIERLQIYGDGRVSPCPGNETILGRVQDYSLQELHRMTLEHFPLHNPTCFDGNCLYRK